jgi:predicted dehydrogenase
MYRSAILGCGPRAVGHAEALAHVTSGRLVAACDVDSGRLDRFCDRFKIADRFTDLRQMVEAARPDLLHVVTTPERLTIIEQAVALPVRAILMEKPLACLPSAGYRILRLCREAGIPLFLNHQLRHHAPFQRVRDAIQAEEIGELVTLRATSKGRLLEQGTHMLDLLSYLLDDAPARSILAQAEGAGSFRQAHPSPDNVLIALRWRGDVPVIVESGPASPTWRGERNFWWNKAVEAVGTRGMIASSTNHGWWMVTDRGSWSEEREYDPEDLLAQARLTEGIFRSFDDPGYRHPNRPEVSPIAFELAQNALRSALERRRISLPAEPVPDTVWNGIQHALILDGGEKESGVVRRNRGGN